MDDALLHWALGQVRGDATAHGIGTLGERTLHAALKYCFEPDARFHERPLAGFVADIARPDGVIEIQTGGFYPLRKKLSAFLARGPVTVVHPLALQKRLIWVDAASGELSAPRKSSRPARLWDVLPEVFWLRDFLPEPGFRVCLVLLAIDEYRLKDGRGPDGKCGGTRFERLPTAFLGQVTLSEPADYARLLPPQLPPAFTAAQFAAAARLRGRRASAALRVLQDCGVLLRTGEKEGRALLYFVQDVGAGAGDVGDGA